MGIRPAPGVIDWSDGMVIPGLIDAHVHLFMSAGFSTAEAIRCATANGADLLALPDLGELAPGRQATLVALQGGPAQFPHNLAVPVIMVSAGRVVYDSRV